MSDPLAGIGKGDGGGGGGKPKGTKLPPYLDPHLGQKFVPSKNGPQTTKINGKTVRGKWVYDKSNQAQNMPEPLAYKKLDGVRELFFPADVVAGTAAYNQKPGADRLNAAQAMQLFKSSDPATRAKIQNMMFRAGGLYTKKYTPSPGAPLTQQDITAFRKFLMGAAANPAQGPIDQTLDAAAQAGDLMGAGTTSVYKPLTEEVTNPQDIKEMASKLGQQLHGTYLTSDQLNVFTAAYQTMEKAYQQQEYTAQGGDISTGMVTPANATAQVVTKPPDASAALPDAIRNADPNKFKANTFTDRLNEILGALKQNINAGDVGGSYS